MDPSSFGDLEAARELICSVPMGDLVAQTCKPEVLAAFDDLVGRVLNTRYYLGPLLSPNIAARLPIVDDPWAQIRRYCAARLGDDLWPAYSVVDLLIRLYQPEGIGAWIGLDVLAAREPRLLFDADGLLYGPVGHVEFKDDTILTDTHMFYYRAGLPNGTRDAFVAELVRFARSNPTRVDYLALAADRDALLERSYYHEMFAKARIRGPIGLSPDRLHDENFPDDPSGVVTEHARVEVDRLQELLCPLIRTEIMWSRRSGIKTIQIEELAPREHRRLSPEQISNRYLHSRWDPEQDAFVHLDGALRSYTAEEYERRLATDLKKADKASGYEKLFRIDGRLPIDTWSTLVGKFFADNELVMEYLGGPAE